MLVMLAGVRMHGTIMGGAGARIIARPLKKSEIFFPTLTIDEFGSAEDYRGALKPIFDAGWNAAGFEASQSYDKDGNWSGGPEEVLLARLGPLSAKDGFW